MVAALLTRAPEIDNATRREFLAVLGAAGLLTACGAEGDGTAAPVGRRQFTDAVGRVVDIPTRPQRIVSLHEATSGGALLSVGAPVVGMVLDESLPERPYDLSGVQGIGTFGEPDLEAITALRPDVILAYSAGGKTFPEGVIGTLERIAPTIAFGEDVPIEQYMGAVATITGLGDEVARQRSVYLEELAALRAAVPRAAELTVVVAGAADAEIYVFIPGNSTASVAIPLALGARPAAVAQRESTDGSYVMFSAERLAEDLRADVILYDSFGEPITRNPLWERLPAVRAGQAHLVPTVFGASYANYRRMIPPLREILQNAMPLGS